MSIGNSDDKLTQAEWSEFITEIAVEVHGGAKAVHGAWFSGPSSRWQNAAWCIEFETGAAAQVAKERITRVRKKYRQDSVAWAVAETEFI